MEGAVEGALGAGFVAGEGGEGVGAAGVVEEDVSVAGVAVEAGVVVVHVAGEVEHAEVEQAGLDAAKTPEAPGGHDDLVGQSALDGVEGLEVVVKGGEGFVESGPFLVGDDGFPGGESVFERVKADGGASVGGLGAGASLSIAAIGFDLTLG